jgi:hypothetical protein
MVSGIDPIARLTTRHTGSRAMMSVRRYTRSDPCPVCSGWAQEHGGRDRCHGFIGSDGRYARCSRVGDVCGSDGLYLHRLDQPCRCGESHGGRGDVESHNQTADYDRDRLFDEVRGRLVPPQGTPAETYMRETRGIDVPLWPGTIAYDPVWGAMVAAIRHCDGRLVGLHVTRLAVNATVSKIHRRTYRRENETISAAGVWLGGGDHRLCVTEGLEDALSAVELYDVPAVSAISAGGIRSLQLPAHITRILLCADGDDVGRRACEAAAVRWRMEGREAVVRPAPAGRDLNDELREVGSSP